MFENVDGRTTDGRKPNIEYRASLYRALNKGPSFQNNGPV